MSEHPIHPATVHFPLTFLTFGAGLDIIYGLATSPSTAKAVHALFDFNPHLTNLALFAHYLNILGLLTAVPSVLSGGQQLMLMIKNQDLVSKLEKSQNKGKTVSGMHPKMKLGFAHAAIMDVSIAGAAYNWWTKRQTVGNAPDEVNVLVSAALLVGVLGAAYLGGSMVYDHGVGIVKEKRVKSQ